MKFERHTQHLLVKYVISNITIDLITFIILILNLKGLKQEVIAQLDRLKVSTKDAKSPSKEELSGLRRLNSMDSASGKRYNE